MEYFGLFFLAVIVEGVITYINQFFVKGVLKWEMVFSILLGVFVSIAYGIDMLAMVGLKTSVPLVGSILTGILVSRGSNYVFDLIKTLTSAHSGMKTSK
ncbi:hypothetical protein [Caproiciproducens faecalis]|uniref:Holin n=1 Tax=Caproiciproducens faecalis TaxID=2820301 RepID=A0ABS7DN83_9FIRM|nr:hypothetical protein [Caproiciproducens faecalis]MBW7572764.1 hypothetical protein [Caproiciproducens faecalis]